MKTRVFAVCVVVFLFCGITHAGLSDGLVAYYPFNGNANDESGNGNNGIVYGATLTTDRFGNVDRAYSFNGVNSYIEVSQSQSLDSTTNKLSLSVWVKFNHDFRYGWGGILWYGPLRNETYGLTLGPDYKLKFSTNWNGSPVDDIIISTTLSENTWYHISFVFTSGQAKAYINGSLTTSIALNNVILPLHANRIFRIGDNYGAISEFWSGVIDDIRIYNRTLSDSEVQQLYSGVSPSVIVKPYTFMSGTPAKAAEVNADFDTLYQQMNALKASFCQEHPTASACQ